MYVDVNRCALALLFAPLLSFLPSSSSLCTTLLHFTLTLIFLLVFIPSSRLRLSAFSNFLSGFGSDLCSVQA
ncbi:hypothetical protein BJ165DRAFT_933827 [Panaeolus papilionaceus]|nr:hypothetical protein BJ165DRAFT_933827 [Panaeolus papilionaceus]